MKVSNKVIEIKNIRAYIERTKVFDRFSLEIAKGCSTAILGPNGAGKSTLLKLLTRDIYPVYNEESYIRILGEERWNVWDLRPHIGIVSQSLQQNYPEYSLGANIILSGYYSSLDTWDHQTFDPEKVEKAESIMRMLGIDHLKDREFSNMSTGEQRRFILGRALINEPDVLVFDEPTSGLDLKAGFQYLSTLRKLIKQGKTAVLVTHHIHEIPPEISRIILLKNGCIIADGNKSEIMTDVNISNLYDIPVKLVELNGFYQVLPS